VGTVLFLLVFVLCITSNVVVKQCFQFFNGPPWFVRKSAGGGLKRRSWWMGEGGTEPANRTPSEVKEEMKRGFKIGSTAKGGLQEEDSVDKLQQRQKAKEGAASKGKEGGAECVAF
jgi:hypothetical protein